MFFRATITLRFQSKKKIRDLESQELNQKFYQNEKYDIQALTFFFYNLDGQC